MDFGARSLRTYNQSSELVDCIDLQFSVRQDMALLIINTKQFEFVKFVFYLGIW